MWWFHTTIKSYSYELEIYKQLYLIDTLIISSTGFDWLTDQVNGASTYLVILRPNREYT